MNISKVSNVTIALLGFLAHGGAEIWASQPKLQPTNRASDEQTFPELDNVLDDENMSVASLGSTFEELSRPQPDASTNPVCQQCQGGCCGEDQLPSWTPAFTDRFTDLQNKHTALGNDVKKLARKVSVLEQQVRPITGVRGEVDENTAAISEAERKINKTNRNFAELSTRHAEDISEIESKIEDLKDRTEDQFHSFTVNIFNKVQEQLKETGEQQKEVINETVSNVTTDLTILKRILGANENDETLNLTENNVATLMKRVENEANRIDFILKRMGPTENLMSHEVFTQLSQGTLPTTPLTVTQMLTELANAYIKFRDDLPKETRDLIDAKFAEIDEVLAPLNERIDGTESEINALKDLLGGISSDSLNKLEDLEQIVAKTITTQLNTEIENKIASLCTMFVSAKLSEMSLNYEQRLKDCETDLIKQQTADENLDQRIKECAQDLEALQALVGNSSGYPSVGSDSLVARIVQLRRDLETLSETVHQHLESAEDQVRSDVLEDKLDKLKQALESDFNAKLGEVRDAIPEDLTSRVETLEEIDHEALQNALDTLSSKVPDNLRTRLETLEDVDHEALQNALDTLSSKVPDNLKTRLETLESVDHEALQNALDTLSSKVPDNLKTRLERLENVDHETLQNALDTLSQDHADLSSRVAALEDIDHNALRGAIDALSRQIQEELIVRLETLENENVDEKITAQIAAFREEIEGKLVGGSGNGTSPTLPENLEKRLEDLELACSAEQVANLRRLLDEWKSTDALNKIIELTDQLNVISEHVQALQDANYGGQISDVQNYIETEVARLEEKINQYEENVPQNLVGQINDLKVQNSSFEAQIAKIKNDLEKQIASVPADTFATLTENVQTLLDADFETKIAEARNAFQSEIEQLTSTLPPDLTDRVEDLDRRVGVLESLYTPDQLVQLKTLLEQVSADGSWNILVALTDRVTKLEQKDASDLSSEKMTALEKRIQAMEDADYETSLANLQSENTRINEQIEALVATHNQEIAAFTQRMDSLQSEKNELQTTIENLNRTVRNLQEQHDQDVGELQSKYTELQDDISQLSIQTTTLATTLSKLQQQHDQEMAALEDKHDQDMGELREQSELFETKLAAAYEALDKFSQVVTAHQTSINGLVDQTNQLSATVSQLRSDFEATKSVVDQLAFEGTNEDDTSTRYNG